MTQSCWDGEDVDQPAEEAEDGLSQDVQTEVCHMTESGQMSQYLKIA